MGKEVFGLQTRILEENTATNGTEIVYTVPANKILYLEEVTIETLSDIVGTGTIIARDNVAARKRGLGSIKTKDETSYNSVQSIFPSFIKLIAGEDIVVISGTAALAVTGMISGLLVNA